MSKPQDPHAKEITMALLDGGFPVSAIAEAARVPVNVVGQWKRGEAGIRPDGIARLDALVPAMREACGATFKALFRARTLKDERGRSIRDLMSAEPLDVDALSAAFRHNARGVARHVATEEASAPAFGRPGSFLSEMPEAGIG